MDGSIGLSTLQKANECFGGPGNYCGREKVFDEFWRGGELALMLGPAGAGKSLLAVQIADALARGREMDGFVMPFWRREKVLYVDLAVFGPPIRRALLVFYAERTPSEDIQIP